MIKYGMKTDIEAFASKPTSWKKPADIPSADRVRSSGPAASPPRQKQPLTELRSISMIMPTAGSARADTTCGPVVRS